MANKTGMGALTKFLVLLVVLAAGFTVVKSLDKESLTVSVELPSAFVDHYPDFYKKLHDVRVTVRVNGAWVVRDLRIERSWSQRVHGAPASEVKVEAVDNFKGDRATQPPLMLECFIFDDNGLVRDAHRARERVTCQSVM